MPRQIVHYIFSVLLPICFFSCGNQNETGSNMRVPLYTLADYHQTGVDFKNTLRETLYMNRLFYEYYYNGGGVAIGDFNNDDLPDLYFISNLESNKLFLNQGNLRFKDVTSGAGVNGKSEFPTGVTTVDINSDGLLDIYVCSSGKFKDPNKRRNELYVNLGVDENGIPKFLEMGADFNLDIEAFSTQASFFDYDLDGDLDMFLINHDINTYSDQQLEAYLNAQGELSGERLYRNENGKYIDVTESSGIVNNRLGFGLGVAIGDTNNDGWPDVYVSNDFSGKDHFYINNKNGTFSEKVNESMRHISFFSMGNDMADYNNDGWLDIITVDMVSEDNYGIKTSMSGMDPNRFYKHVELGLHHQYMFNTLQTNMGTLGALGPYFSETAQLAGISNTDWSWAPLFLDMDNDGFQDLFVSNGIKRDFRNNDFIMYHKKVRDSLSKYKNIDRESYINDIMSKMPARNKGNYFFLNNTDLSFSNEGAHWGLDSLKTSSNGASYADLDNDGDLDIVVNNMDEYAHIYENNADKTYNHFLKIKLKGPSGNTMGVGARVKVMTDDKIQVREQYVSRGFQSSISEVLHFGLGKNKNVDRIEVHWPNGSKEVIEDVVADRILELDHKNAAKKNKVQKTFRTIFNDITENTLNHRHEENPFDDFKREGLLPHKMSRQGPAVAVGDINADGLDDFFIGGALNDEGKIYLQNIDGSFHENEQHIFKVEKEYEDVGAEFFDADSDGDLDLYVVSGGNENPVGSYKYQDRLYENRNGVFINSKNALPKLEASGGCVRPFDFDDDGDLDLFVGGRQVPGQYPNAADSYILLNESGNGTISFVDVTDETAPALRALGMVTDATWGDMNNDGLQDLVITGEWMPITILENRGGYFENATVDYGMAHQTGWWYGVHVLDYDRDGDMDIFAGNLGLNYKYKASQNEPFEVYAEDFDNSGSLDIVLGYYNDGELFPLRGRQCSSEQMPFIAKKYGSYHAFAEATLNEVYGTGNLKGAVHYAAQNFASTYFENNGSNEFTAHSLPPLAQFSSVNCILTDDFDADGHWDVLLAGNLYTSEIETPRNDGGYGMFLKGKADGAFEPIPSYESGIFLKGEVKALRLLKTTGGKKIVMAVKNNEYLQFLNPNNTQKK